MDRLRGRGWLSGTRNGRARISASDLARLGYCEAKTVFDAHRGERVTAEQRARREDGQRAHQQFHDDGQNRASPGDRRCYVASHIFGSDAAETDLLRRYRDAKLLPYPAGRLLVSAYYSVSPWLCRILPRVPGARATVRAVLLAIVARMSERVR